MTLVGSSPMFDANRAHRDALLRILHPIGYRDLRAFRALDSTVPPTTASLHADDVDGVDRFANRNHDRDVYVGVAPRQEGGRDATTCLALYALFVDQDYKHSSEAEARKRLAGFPFPPSATVASGGGLQAYWFLQQPLDLTNGGIPPAKHLLRSLATALGADLSAAEPARILRLPGSYNHKYDPPRLVVIEELFGDRLYSVEEITQATVGSSSTPKADPLPKAVPDGRRNPSLFVEGCRLRRLGWEESEILAGLLEINRQRCDPPGDPQKIAGIAQRCAKYAPGDIPSQTHDLVDGEPPPPNPIQRVPYAFEPAFPPGHFVSNWIEIFSKQCDAALEYHEAAALVALAQMTPTLMALISGSSTALHTNLYVLFIGLAGWTRKSTAKDYAKEAIKSVAPGVLLPEQMTQESLVESLTFCNDGAALWAIDEFTDMLSKMLSQTHLAGMRGTLLELYSQTNYTYRRVSKRTKKQEDGERQEDAFYVSNVSLSVLGCATPTLFDNLDSTAVGSGLLTRFAIVMPEGKPPRLPQYELPEGDITPPALLKWLQDIQTRTVNQFVKFDTGVLQRLDEAIDKPLDESADRCLMTVRAGVMSRKVAMLAAAGRPIEGFHMANEPLVVTMEDAESAIRVVNRWITYGQAFETKMDETSFEVDVKRCVDIVKGQTVLRRDIARRVHLPARMMTEIEQTLVQRGEIELIEYKPPTGRSSWAWKWIG